MLAIAERLALDEDNEVTVDLPKGVVIAHAPPSFRVEPPAFHLHVWFPDGEGGHLVTHQVPVGEFDGPHPFFSADGKLL